MCVLLTYLRTHESFVLVFRVYSSSNIIGSCVFCAPLDRCIGRYIDSHSTDTSVDISTDTRPICRSTYRSTHGRYIDRDMSVDMSVDMLTEISAECRSMYRPTVGRYLGRYSARHSADTLTIDCRWNIGRLSVVYRSTVGGISVDCRIIYYDYQLSKARPSLVSSF